MLKNLRSRNDEWGLRNQAYSIPDADMVETETISAGAVTVVEIPEGATNLLVRPQGDASQVYVAFADSVETPTPYAPLYIHSLIPGGSSRLRLGLADGASDVTLDLVFYS